MQLHGWGIPVADFECCSKLLENFLHFFKYFFLGQTHILIVLCMARKISGCYKKKKILHSDENSNKNH